MLIATFKNQKIKNTKFFRLFKWLTLVFGLSSSLGFYWQAYEIWQHHSAGSVAFGTYSYWAFVNLIFALYMMMEDNKVVMSTSLANVTGCAAVMLLLIVFSL